MNTVWEKRITNLQKAAWTSKRLLCGYRVTKSMLDNRRVVVRLLVGARDFSCLQTAPTGSQRRTNVVFNWYRGFFPRGVMARPILHLPAVRWWRMSAAVPPFPHTPSLCAQGQLLTFIKITLTLLLCIESQPKERYDVTGPVSCARGLLLVL